MKRILLLTPDDPFSGSGGLGETLRNLLYFFEQHHKDYFFDIICVSNTNRGNNFTCYAINEFSIPQVSYSFDIISDGLCYVMIKYSQYLCVYYKYLMNNKYDLIHVNDYSTAYAGKILSEQLNCDILFSCQLSICYTAISKIQKNNKNLLVENEIKMMQNSKLTIFASNYYANQLSLFTNNYCIIPNGICLNEWENVVPYNFNNNNNNNKINVIYIGRLTDEKNILNVVNSKLPDNFNLYIIGSENGSNPYIVNTIKNNNNPQITYLGPKYGCEKISLLKGADIQIIPSTHEPFGIVVLEALASSNIILTSFVGGIKEIVNENVAINCGTTVESIENSYNEYIKLNEEQKKNMVSLGHEIVKKYDWENIGDKYFKSYEFVMNL